MRRPRPTALLILTFIFLGMVNPEKLLAAATGYQICAPNSSCIIGEFLYDDEYIPIATATCTLTSRNPDNSLFLNAVNMTAGSDGWYSYNATTVSTEGVYHSQICCTAGTDYLCLDKSFEVKQIATTSSTLNAADVWGYSDRSLTTFGTLTNDIWSHSTRTLSSFGSLAGDVWGYSSRSLSNFGNLIADIWNYGTRTITGGSVTTTNITNITNQQLTNMVALTTENRQLLEQLVNKPIIQNFIDETSNLQSKIEKSKNITNRLYTSIADLKSRADLLELSWQSLNTVNLEQ